MTNIKYTIVHCSINGKQTTHNVSRATALAWLRNNGEGTRFHSLSRLEKVRFDNQYGLSCLCLTVES